MKYNPTIGLEIHAELKTQTKMFCDCRSDPDEKHQNQNVCPVCLGHPGTLPTINRAAVEAVIKVGLALGGEINTMTKFDRKNYFYPDLPKGYQISQYDEPLIRGGSLGGVPLTRIHLEEDVGRLAHAADGSLVNFNRAGIPLMELVTEPALRSAEEVVAFARELQLLLRYLGVSDADMEKGNMRIEANVSINLGPKTELKNINSFRAVHDAVEYEIKRQTEALKNGENLIQETRGWDEVKSKTFHQRTKESAHDYRYFPEPDLPPFESSVFNPEDLRRHLPELPWEKRARFKKQYELGASQVELLISEKVLADFFEAAVSELQAREEDEPVRHPQGTPDLLVNYLTSDLRGAMNELGFPFSELKITPEHLAHLVDLIVDGKIGSRQAKDILRRMVETGSDPEEILRTENLETVSDKSELAKVIKEVLGEHSAAVQDYKKGKTASLQFFIGQAMAKLRGRGDPKVLQELFLKQLK